MTKRKKTAIAKPVDVVNDSIIDMKVNRKDLVDYLVDKEVARLKVIKDEFKKQYDAFDKEVTKYRDSIELILIAIAKTTIPAFALYPTATIQVRVVEKRGSWREDMMISMMYGRRIMFGEEHDSGPPREYEKSYAAHISEGNRWLASFNFELDDKDYNRLTTELKSMREKLSALGAEVNRIDNEIYDVKQNSSRIKNALIEQYLSTSEEGKKLQKQLDSITLSNVKELK